MGSKSTEYKKNFNKNTYKTNKIYIPLEIYPNVEAHWKQKGYKSLNAYVNALIKADMQKSTVESRIAVNVKSSRKLDRLRLIARARAGEKKYQIEE